MPKKAKNVFIGKDPLSIGVLARKYLDHGKIKGVQKHTLISYKSRIRMFIIWCEERGIELISEVSRPVMEAYQRHLAFRKSEDKKKQISTVSQNGHLTTLLTFFGWMAEKRYIIYNPVSDISIPSVPSVTIRDTMTVEEIEKILSQPKIKENLGLRDRAIMEVFYSTGIRRRELCDLQIFDVDLEEHTLIIRRGKNGDGRLIPLGKRASKWVEKYLDESREKLLKHEPTDSLFITVNGSPMSLSLISPTLKKYFNAADVSKKGCSHLFRHSMATLMLKNGADIRVVQEILGHNQITTTQIYTHLNIEHLQEAYNRTHPGQLTWSEFSSELEGKPHEIN